MTTQKRSSVVEIHLAVPKSAVTQVLVAELARVGFKKAKYFLGVLDVRDESVSCNPLTPPTGHDIQDPGMMFTLKVPTIEEGIAYVKAGMSVLDALGVYGNFEIEGQIGPSLSSYREIDLVKELPGYKEIKDAPAYENHIVWRGTLKDLPTNAEIIAFVQTMGISPHQIVDFARVESAGPDDIVSRVATVYQPDEKSVFAFSDVLESMQIEKPYAYAIGERVMMVGEKDNGS